MRYIVTFVLVMVCTSVYAGNSSLLAAHPNLKEESEKKGIWSGGNSAGNSVSESSDLFVMDVDNSSTELPANMVPIKYGQDSWTIEDGKLLTSGVLRSGERRLVFGEIDENGNIDPDAWTDYSLSLDANLKTVDGLYGNGYGVYYRGNAEDDITSYIFQYDPGAGDRFIVRKVTDGREAQAFQKVKMSTIFPDDFNIADATHKIEIEVHGEQHVIKVDDVEVFNFNDSWRLSGSGGLRAWSKSTVEFSDITVGE